MHLHSNQRIHWMKEEEKKSETKLAYLHFPTSYCEWLTDRERGIESWWKYQHPVVGCGLWSQVK